MIYKFFFKKGYHLVYDTEAINKIIKIQSYVRGAEMRDKIKLKSRHVNNINKSTETPDKSEINFQNATTLKNEEENEKIHPKYNEIIVNYNIYINY